MHRWAHNKKHKNKNPTRAAVAGGHMRKRQCGRGATGVARESRVAADPASGHLPRPTASRHQQADTEMIDDMSPGWLGLASGRAAQTVQQ